MADLGKHQVDSLEGVLLGIGNPLLDISASVPAELLTKYGAKPGNAILAEEKHLPLYDELIKNYPVEYIAGGAAQNSIRAAQWMLKDHPHACGYIGSVGDDENAKRLKEAAEKGGVKTHYYVTKEAPTGTCAVLVVDKERSLIANLGAANHYKKTHFETVGIQEVVNKAKYFYSTGFFLTVSPETVVAIGKHAVAHNKTVLFNLAAPFVIDFFFDALCSVLPYADVVFGNETEALTLGKKMGWGEDLIEIAQKLRDYEKVNKNRKRTVVFTQGAKSTLVVRQDQVETFAPIACDPKNIVDTNGAGDSFVGGFLSQYVQGFNLERSIAAGHYAAWECIQRSGATYPEKPNFVYNH